MPTCRRLGCRSAEGRSSTIFCLKLGGSGSARCCSSPMAAAGAGTGGALHAARSRLEDRFLLLDGHSWFDFNWLSLVTVEGAADAVATLALRKVGDSAHHLLLDGSMVR